MADPLSTARSNRLKKHSSPYFYGGGGSQPGSAAPWYHGAGGFRVPERQKYDEGLPGSWRSPRSPQRGTPPPGWGSSSREPQLDKRKKRPPGSWRGPPRKSPYEGPEEPHSKGKYPRMV